MKINVSITWRFSLRPPPFFSLRFQFVPSRRAAPRLYCEKKSSKKKEIRQNHKRRKANKRNQTKTKRKKNEERKEEEWNGGVLLRWLLGTEKNYFFFLQRKTNRVAREEKRGSTGFFKPGFQLFDFIRHSFDVFNRMLTVLNCFAV